MKKLLLWAGALLAVSIWTVSCDDDDDDKAVYPLVEAAKGIYTSALEISRDDGEPVLKNTEVSLVADGDDVEMHIQGFELDGTEMTLVLDDVNVSGNTEDVRLVFSDEVYVVGYGKVPGYMTGSVQVKNVLNAVLKLTLPTSYGRSAVVVNITGNRK